MSQQPILRNVTSMDRGPVVRLTTEDVLKAARAYVGEFTTVDIADAMDEREYSIRIALVWLVRRGVIERCGTRSLRTKRGEQIYFANTYRVRQDVTEVDFAALNRLSWYRG